jgi:hypothetical protein
MEPPVSDPRFTLPESPELLARAEAVARERMEARDLALLPFYGGLTGLLLPWSACEPSTRRDLTEALQNARSFVRSGPLPGRF